MLSVPKKQNQNSQKKPKTNTKFFNFFLPIKKLKGIKQKKKKQKTEITIQIVRNPRNATLQNTLKILQYLDKNCIEHLNRSYSFIFPTGFLIDKPF